MFKAAASIGLLAMVATLAWCASLVLPRPPADLLRWWHRVLTAAKIAGFAGALIVTFVFGLGLTSQPFPTGRTFLAVSLNGAPIVSARADVKFPTLHVGRAPLSSALNASGTGHCNYWSGKLSFFPPNFIIWNILFRTAMGCAALNLEDQYFRALLGATRWRIENGALILYNGTDTLRFFLAPA